MVATYVASQAAEVGSAYNNTLPFISHDFHIAASWEIAGDIWSSDWGVNPPAICQFGSVAGPEEAWRCYNYEGIDTEYDMPPNYYSYSGIPFLHGPTSPDYETLVANVENWGRSYYSNINQAAERVINFHNQRDRALWSWEFNQLTKPDSNDSPVWEYEFEWDCPYNDILCMVDVFPDAEDNDKVYDVYWRDGLRINWNSSSPINVESAGILGHIIPSRTNALGQLSAMGQGSVVNQAVDLSRAPFGFSGSNQGHSAQFYSSYANRDQYWSRLLLSFTLLPTDE